MIKTIIININKGTHHIITNFYWLITFCKNTNFSETKPKKIDYIHAQPPLSTPVNKHIHGL